MKWGVRNDRATLKERFSSLKRERQWKKLIGEIDGLTTEQLHTVSKRIGLENDLKRLTKDKKIATDSDRKDYIRRANMSDDELTKKVVHLRAKSTLVKNISNASKEQRELGEKIVNIGGTMAMKYATNKSLTPKDLFDSVSNPVNIKDRGLKTLVESVLKDQASKQNKNPSK